MSGRYPVEALLRPPVEVWSAVSAGTGAVLVAMVPGAFLMPPAIAHLSAVLLGALAVRRALEARRVLRYQRTLRRLPRYTLKAHRLPLSRTRLFLGRGFRWTQQHTQRLHDAQQPTMRRYLEAPAWRRWLEARALVWERRRYTRPLMALLRWEHRCNPLRPRSALGGLPQLHTVEPDEHDVWMRLDERPGHMLVIGTTRVGKTRFEELLVAQDIRRGDVVVVIDPKGDAELLRRVYVEARRAGRDDVFYLFHLGYPAVSARYNAVGRFDRITEVASRTANPLPRAGNSAAFREFAWRFTNIVTRARVALGRRPDYRQILRDVSDIDPLLIEYYEHWLDHAGPKEWRSEVQKQRASLRQVPQGRDKYAAALIRYASGRKLYEPVAAGLRSAFQYDRTYFDKIVASLLPLLEKLTTGKVAELIAPDYEDLADTRPILDWLEVIRRRGIVYVGLDALADREVANAVGNAMFADLVTVAGHLYKHGAHHGLPKLNGRVETRPTVCLHADEFNQLIGPEFIELVNKGGGAGMQVTAYTQTLADIEARLGDRAQAQQTVGNFNTLVMLRVKDPVTAALLTDQMRSVDVLSLTEVSGVSDSFDAETGIDFSSSNQDRLTTTRVPMLAPADVMGLPKGHAFALLEGGELWKLRMPLPDGRRDPKLAPDIEAVIADMGARYTTNDTWWQLAPLNIDVEAA